MTQCPGRDQLELFLDNGLKGTDCDELEHHVETCAACQETLDALTSGTEFGPWGDRAADGSAAAARPTLDLDPNQSEDGGRAGSAKIAEGPGSSIGPYTLAEKMGEGGMGIVYLAEQNIPVRRKVALKIIKPGMDSAQVIARFEAERQALALMNHPGIARVLDAGTTAAGRPFFVMELVDGSPITAHCDRAKLPLFDRLALFISLCQAIQHAHQKGIIHRDIKPSNVLVTHVDGQAVPKVIDFGIAKAIDQRLTEKTMFTQHGAIVGSLEYMSPEQADLTGIDVDTRSDVYALGAVLYQLLTGTTPLANERIRKAGYEQILRWIRTEEPPKPSSRLSDSGLDLAPIAAMRGTEPSRLARLVKGELDWIVMKALEKDRARRYESASALARDLKRFLDGDPVEAGPPGAAYRFGKFARKHRAALATAGAFAAFMIAATVLSTWLAVRAIRAERTSESERNGAILARNAEATERSRAQDREQMAIDAVRRYGDVLRESPGLKDEPALVSLRATLLKEPQAFFKTLRDRLAADKNPSRESLHRLAHASSELGRLTAEIGDKPDALGDHEEALAIFESLAAGDPSASHARVDLAGSHFFIGSLLHETGREALALASLEQARALYQRLADENPPSTLFQRDLARTMSSIGIVQLDMGRPADAMAAHEQARAIYERLVREFPSDAKLERELAQKHNNIGAVHRATGHLDEGLRCYDRARAILDRLVQKQPSAAVFDDLAAITYNIGRQQRDAGRTRESLKSLEAARTIASQLVHQNPSATRFQSLLGSIHDDVGALEQQLGRTSAALAAFAQAREIHERLALANPAVTRFQSDLSATHTNIGIAQIKSGRPAEAIASFQKSRAIDERLVRDNPSGATFQNSLATSYQNTGNIQRDTGLRAEALQSYEQARTIRERLAKEHPAIASFSRHLASIHTNIGDVQVDLHRPKAALESFQRAREILETLASDHPSSTDFQSALAGCKFNIGRVEHASGRLPAALEWLEQARATWDRLARANPSVALYQSNLATCLARIGSLKRQTGRLSDALQSFEEARAIQERQAREHPESPNYVNNLAGTLNDLAKIELNQRRFEQARARLEQAVAYQRKALAANPKNPTYRQNLTNQLDNLILAAQGLGRPAEAVQARRERFELAAADPAMASLDARLVAVIKGQAPKDNAERIRLSSRAYATGLYAFAVGLLADALQNDPKLSDDRKAEHCYVAACCAALAASGQGRDNPPPDQAARDRLRRQALDWLRAELDQWGKALAANPAAMKNEVRTTLVFWKGDNDLASLREPNETTILTERDRALFAQLWKDVEKLLLATGAGGNNSPKAAQAPGVKWTRSSGPELPRNPFVR